MLQVLRLQVFIVIDYNIVMIVDTHRAPLDNSSPVFQ